MKTAMGMGKAKVWISETVGSKIATRLFRGVALGVLLVAATGLYFSINRGEAGSSAIRDDSPVRTSKLDTRLHTNGMDFVEDSAAHVPAPTTNLTREQLELIEDYNVLGIHWRIDGQGKVVVVEMPIGGVLVDVTRNPAVGSRLSSEQLEFAYDLEMMGFPWRIDDQGRVVVVEEPRESVAPTVIDRYDRSLDDEFMLDAPFFHALNQGKVGSRPSINGITCYPEDDC